MMGISIWQLLIIFAIILLLFGTKRLRSLGSDLGSAVKGFKNAVSDKDDDADFKQTSKMEDQSPKQQAEAHNKTKQTRD